MGMRIPVGAAGQRMFKTGITGDRKIDGPSSISSNQYAGPHMANFLRELHEAGAPLNDYSGTFNDRNVRGGSSKSQHAYGNAVDIETGLGHGPDNSPALWAWSQKNPGKLEAIAARNNMKNMGGPDYKGRQDWGHFEYNAPDKKPQTAGGTGAGAPSTRGHTSGGSEDGVHGSEAAGHLKDLHSLRSELEKPIKMRVEAPNVPHHAPIRRMAGRQQERWTTASQTQAARHSSPADIGVA
jgi:hypothetical protein